MARQPSTYEALNAKMRGQFPRYLRTRLDRGESFQDIAWALADDYEVRVTAEAIRRWCKRYANGTDSRELL